LTRWDSSWPRSAKKDEQERLFSYLEERFGIPQGLFDDYLLFRRKSSWYLLRRAPQLATVCSLKTSKTGLRAFQKIGAFLKPTTRFIQIFGKAATRAKVEIDEEQLRRLIADEALSLDLDLDNGYVILTLEGGQILGLGLLIDGRVRSQIPRKELRQPMMEKIQSMQTGK
jgi:NOL1/NOP2/fmu family ribosome biogenesis protein